MKTTITPTPTPSTLPPRAGASSTRYWPGLLIAVIGMVAGVAIGINSYQDSQQQIDTFARMSIPGEVTVQIDQPDQQVIYYEGVDNLGFEDLEITVSDPTGVPVTIKPFDGELIYETTNLTQGHAMATFDTDRAGTYEIQVSGVNSGQLTVGESFSRLALPGVLAGLVIAGLSVIAGLVLSLRTFMKRSRA